MNKSLSKNTEEREMLLKDAAEVFSKGYVEMISKEGLDFIEDGGYGSTIIDSLEKEYLDCFSSAGTFNLGRSRKELAMALKTAARGTDQGNFVAISTEKSLLAEKLAGFMPGQLECSLFTVVRGEAIDAACKLARGYTGRSEIVTVEGGWYGHTGFAMSLSSDEREMIFGPEIPEISLMPFGDIEAAKKIITGKTAAVVLETIQAENGCRYTDNAYYTELKAHCDKIGAVLIVDESQTGFGRTGKPFSFEEFGFEPDIAVLGEALGGGMFPMTAISFTKKLKSFFDDHPMIHLCTFGGHDVGCWVAIKAIELYENEQPWKNAEKKGDLLLKGLKTLGAKYSALIDDIQGFGLLLSINFCDEKNAQQFCMEAGKNGMVCVRGRIDGSSVLVRPSLTIKNSDVDTILSITKSVLEILD